MSKQHYSNDQSDPSSPHRYSTSQQYNNRWSVNRERSRSRERSHISRWSSDRRARSPARFDQATEPERETSSNNQYRTMSRINMLDGGSSTEPMDSLHAVTFTVSTAGSTSSGDLDSGPTASSRTVVLTAPAIVTANAEKKKDDEDDIPVVSRLDGFARIPVPASRRKVHVSPPKGCRIPRYVIGHSKRKKADMSSTSSSLQETSRSS